MSFFVYIIYSVLLDKYYIGYTSDLAKRLSEHKDGISNYTSKASDWVLKHIESYSSRELAMKREREIKRKKSRKYLEWLINSPSITWFLAFACPDSHREKGHRFDSGNLHRRGHPERFWHNLHRKRKGILKNIGRTSRKLQAHLPGEPFSFSNYFSLGKTPPGPIYLIHKKGKWPVFFGYAHSHFLSLPNL